jgi:type VII secretion protein EccE
MRKLHSVRLKFSAAYTFWTAALAPLGVALFLGTLHQELELYLLAAIVAGSAVFALVTFRGRRVAGWAAAAARWVVRRRWRPHAPTEAAIGATVQPGDPVAVRWEGRSLVAVIKLIPQPFTPTVVVDGRARTDDVLDTKLLEHVLSASCPDLEADVVSAGYRVSRSAAPDVVDLYARLIDRDPAPAHRRTWIMLRADPQAAQRSAQRRDADIAGLARYLVASTTRVADQLAEKGIDAVC